jgi:hypothetical protein
MAVEVALVALVGSGASLIGTSENEKTSKIVRRGVSGWSLAFFGGQDLAALIQHVFSFEVSQGACVFLTGFIGAALLERMLVLINAVSARGLWGKHDDK